MKHKFATVICTIMLFVPWTILPLRAFDWALESPTAEVMISCYAAFMIFSGIFTIVTYIHTKPHPKSSGNLPANTASPQGKWLQVCAVINGLYMIAGVAAFCMMGITNFS